MGFCFQTSLLQPATHILQAILMFLESPPNNNHIIQISRTCGPLNSCQNQIHVPLRGARGIAETKRRHVKLREWDTLSLDKLLDESALGRSHRAHLERSALGSSSACLLFLSPSLLVLSCSEKGWPFKPSLLRRAPALLRPPGRGEGGGGWVGGSPSSAGFGYQSLSHPYSVNTVPRTMGPQSLLWVSK